MYDSILIPTDGSAGAEAAMRHGLGLAAGFDSELHLLSVVDERTYSSAIADVDSGVRAQRETLEREATEAVETLEASVAETDVTAHTTIEHGVPSEAILAYLDREAIDLVSMGTHGRTGLERFLVGSVTERVVRTSDVPVLTVQSEPTGSGGYDRVLIPTDGSTTATAAIDHGVAIAERFDATVHALSVVNESALQENLAVEFAAEVRTARTERAERAVAAVAERCEAHGLDVVTDVGRGTPHRVIREYVDDHGIDVVTMGTEGRTGLERYLLGSVTERVVRTSDAPVLTVRAGRSTSVP